jgi:predicted AlkP superfamily pyrophosphatase or phosphodiesterase
MIYKILTGFLFLSGIFIFKDLSAQKTVKDNYVVILSMDGFRWDYPDSFPTPNLNYIARNGVKAKSMIPSFPSVTFPNHYTLATGLYPNNHGIVHNDFYDSALNYTYKISDRKAVENGKFYGGEPIWITAMKNGLKAASFYWVGSEADIQGQHPNYWEKYDKNITYEQRIDTVIYWLTLPEAKRPRLIMFYFDEPDHTSHEFGPISAQTRAKVMYCDSMVGLFLKKLKKLPVASKVNFMVVSDHGMGSISDSKKVAVMDYIKESWVARMNGGNPVFSIEPAAGCYDSIMLALKNIKHIRFWDKKDVPVNLHFGSNSRINRIVVLADSSYSVVKTPATKISGGTHGYSPENTDMHAIFYALGPVFKKNMVVPSFENVNIYPLMAYILGITPAKSDGNLKNVEAVLKKVE